MGVDEWRDIGSTATIGCLPTEWALEMNMSVCT